MSFYKKSKSGIVPKNFYSEKKVRNQNKAKRENKNDNDSSDKDIDGILDIFLENENENKLNKTMIAKLNGI